MKVLVNGLGNIGTTVTALLLKYQEELGIDEVWACKRTIEKWHQVELDLLMEKGALICTSGNNPKYPKLSEIEDEVNYIFETTANGVGMVNRVRYQLLPNLIGSCAQGSEKEYGTSFMSGVNNSTVWGEKFVHVVSCNTHGSAALMRTFAGKKLENLSRADMVVVRRSEDIGNHSRLVTANVVARHLDEKAGTHHMIDVNDMFKTIGVYPKFTASSDITTPSQLMHSVRFNIELKKKPSKSILELIHDDPYMSTTKKFDSNKVFELGRRYGFNGRLFSHAIILAGNLLVEDTIIKGWAFVPQEGNTLLSTIHSFLLQTKHPHSDEVMNKLLQDLCREEW